MREEVQKALSPARDESNLGMLLPKSDEGWIATRNVEQDAKTESSDGDDGSIARLSLHYSASVSDDDESDAANSGDPSLFHVSASGAARSHSTVHVIPKRPCPYPGAWWFASASALTRFRSLLREAVAPYGM
eukprot:2322610-Pleurochrysis_carterae.AAC.1